VEETYFEIGHMCNF